MIYPPQTSLIPVTVAIARFVENHGFTGIYPFWYLGVPVKFLAGPIIPSLLVGLHKLLPAFSFFDLSYALIFVSFIVGAFGWGMLTWMLSKNKKMGLVAGILFLILPWKWLSALALSEVSVVVAVNVLPLVLVVWYRYLGRGGRLNLLFSVAVLSVLLFINTSIIPTLVVGMAAVSLAASFREGRFRNLSHYIKRLLNILILALAVVTVWYPPAFWWTILVNPSLGGASGWQVIFRLFDFLKTFLPFSMAVFVVFLAGKIKNKLAVFSLIWLFTFAFLTFFRFLANVDFWQDWTSWFFELEIGLALVLAWLFPYFVRGIKIGVVDKKISFVMVCCLLLPFVVTWNIYNRLSRPALITTSLPAGISSLEQLNQVANGKKVFLSGSTVFWANSLYDLYQIRGGRDEASTNPGWLKASYEIREGFDPQKTIASLKKLGVVYILVHGADSLEYYHDFKNPEKWDKIGRKIWEKQGDMIYKIDY
ncbi:MAG: hypothetical protein Q8P10_01490 [bacterium]|nr:hypothetical protein [bacterium]